MSKRHYQLDLVRSADKNLLRLMRSDRRRILEALQGLRDDPRPRGCTKLVGGEGYRIKVGPYRITYAVDDDNSAIVVRSVRHRKDAYRVR